MDEGHPCPFWIGLCPQANLNQHQVQLRVWVAMVTTPYGYLFVNPKPQYHIYGGVPFYQGLGLGGPNLVRITQKEELNTMALNPQAGTLGDTTWVCVGLGPR